MSNILEIQQLSKSYRSVKAIKNLSIHIDPGQAFGLLGPNGSGKTTTLSILTGILRQDTGTYSWFGETPSPGQRTRIGSLIETPHFYPYLNLEKNLRIICTIKNIGFDDIELVLKETRLFERRKSRFKTLSLGMKQRLGIAAALLGDPRVLVLDEPTNGLDPEGIAEVRETIIEQVERGKTLILASHILSEVEKICSHVAILKNGDLLAAGSVKEILTEEEVVEFSSSDNAKLLRLLEENNVVTEARKENGVLVALLQPGMKIGDLNTFAFGNGVVIDHLVSRKKSLEAQFLELVKE
ncbi:MAG: ABC transporter ATP-binding protein [Bacteroidales bacterium]|nr:ABC transporter ATP-binding protein [Bacteroidales bacterium]MDT8430288.1 ABC transporter ATP-binding protein [Bacteroidales bacterium]